MCTAVSFHTENHYFGRNLDLEYHYREEVTVTPRKYLFKFRNGHTLKSHYAMIGMATVDHSYPLYYEATNECGLSIAGLNFPGNAIYLPADEHKDNVASFELIPWILATCKDLQQAYDRLKRIQIWDEAYSRQFPPSPLHWMVSDRNGSIVAEPGADGLKLYENPYRVLTNNPPFPYHIHNLSNYMGLTREPANNRFASELSLLRYSNGMGAIGLPGDLSSPSRFVRATFVRSNSVCGSSESESISQFFHILDSVCQQRGCARVNDDFEITYYSSCCNTDKGIYYYKTYDNSQINAVDMHRANLEASKLITYPLIIQQQINQIN